ncbi:MAG: LamG-like jellyroll fold domain-containing protein [Clostridia bacterium]
MKKYSLISRAMLSIFGVLAIGYIFSLVIRHNPIDVALNSIYAEDLKSYKQELKLGKNKEKISTLRMGNQDIDAKGPEIQKYIPQFKAKYYNELEISNGKLAYIGRDPKKEKVAIKNGMEVLEPCSRENILMWFSKASMPVNIAEYKKEAKDLGRFAVKADMHNFKNNEKSGWTADGLKFSNSYLKIQDENLKYMLRTNSDITYEFNITLPKQLSKSPLAMSSGNGDLVLKLDVEENAVVYEFRNQNNNKSINKISLNKNIKDLAGETVHIAITTNVSSTVQTIIVYINAQMAGFITTKDLYNENIFKTTNNIYLGEIANEESMESTLNTFRIYNKALNQDEIDHNYKAKF